MRATVRLWQSSVVLLLLGLASCQSPTPRAPVTPEPTPAVTPPTSQPAPTVALPSSQPGPQQRTPTSAPVPYPVEPGIYKFKARVETVDPVESYLQHKMLDGAGVSRGERYVWTGVDLNWKIRLAIQEVYDPPLSFLKAGEQLTFVVHSADQVFGRKGESAVGQVFDFSLTITHTPKGRLHYGPLTTPTGAFAKEGGFARQ